MVVGGGFGGLNVARELADADVDVTVVDRTNHHLFQPLLYQVGAGILSPGLIAPALRGILKQQANARTLLANVHDIDLDAKVVRATAPDGRPVDLPYDTLAVAAGASHSYFGRDEFAEYAPGMKTVEDARYLRDSILGKFEMAEVATDPAERAEWLTFVVVGAGPTGVETVGQIAELAHTVLPRDYRSINTHEARIVLLEGAPSVLPPFHKKLQQYAHRQLEKMGVEVHVNSLATAMDHESITFKGPEGEQTIRGRTRIWAAGVAASPLAKLLASKTGLETDRAGRVPVNPDCTVDGHPEVFAIGDMVSLNKLPGVAQPALQEGRYVGKVIKARLAGGEGRQALQVLRQGLDGHDRLPLGGGRRVRGQGHRHPGLPHVGVRARLVPDRLGQPDRHDLPVAARAGLHQEPQPPDHHVRPHEPGLRQGARREPHAVDPAGVVAPG